MKTRGLITLVFDDGYEEVYEWVMPLLRKFNIQAVFAVPTDTNQIAEQTGEKITPLSTWKEVCRAEKHELAAHGVAHEDLTRMDREKMQEILSESKRITSASTLVYPGGAYNDLVEEQTRKYYSAARTTDWGIESLPPLNRFRLKTVNATRKNFSVCKWNLLALYAFIKDGWLIETYHQVSQDRKNFYSVTERELFRHLSFIAKLPLRTATIEEMIPNMK